MLGRAPFTENVSGALYSPGRKLVHNRSVEDEDLGSSTSRGVARRGQSPAKGEKPADADDARIRELVRKNKNVEPTGKAAKDQEDEEGPWEKVPHSTAVDRFWI
jgi:hypothetical protein